MMTRLKRVDRADSFLTSEDDDKEAQLSGRLGQVTTRRKHLHHQMRLSQASVTQASTAC